MRALRPAKSSHAPLALTGGLMAVLGTIVHARIGLHERVPDGRKLRHLGLRGWIAVQLVRDDLAWSLPAGGQHALEEAFRCKLIAHPFLESIICMLLCFAGGPPSANPARWSTR